MKHKKIIQTLSLEQKVELITGHSYWYTKEFKELGIPSIRMSDGPYGLRITSFMQEEAKKSTCFPPLCTLGNTFNEELAYNMGLALGEECLENKIDIILGPGINIKRNPLCGRNFEYISEDPYLSGTLASNYIKGVQQKGVGTSLKHFACNSEEENRCISSSNVDLRALREIYLKGFEIAVKNSSPTTIMASYNFINGIQA
jgi:beta-glucosidase